MATRSLTPESGSRRRILDAATRILARRGYHDANVDEIVARSGTSKGGFYFHFPSKERMVVALVEELSGRLVARVERSINHEAKPARRLAVALSALMHTLAGKRRLARVLLINIIGQGKALDRKFLPVRDRFAGVIQKELDGAVATGAVQPLDTAMAAQVWLGALHEVVYRWLMVSSPPPITAMVSELGAMLFQSVGLSREQFAGALEPA